MSSLQVEVVAADRKVWEGDASMITARSIEGELGIMPGHTPLLGVLVEGEIGIHTEGGRKVAVIDSGFLSVDHDHVTIVAESVDASSLTA
ncbi:MULTISPECIES: F0F1 ATP synthase subunit epsilon [unclassified Janibacter]|uniref:F0F1 ATP synthase subunit epsilon n=1 Tax=unclassified Janibacter TaxID=2649294 RepID=UPI003D075AA6